MQVDHLLLSDVSGANNIAPGGCYPWIAVGVGVPDIKVCCAAELYGYPRDTGDADRDPKNPVSNGEEDRDTYCAKAFDESADDMLRGGVGVEDPDEFVE